MKSFTPELIAKAKAAKSPEELFALAKANSIEITEEEAKTYFAQLGANGIVSDEELDIVAGGLLGCPDDEEEDSQSSGALRQGLFVRVTDGSRCPSCQTDRGILRAPYPTDASMGVFCKQCCKWITFKATKDNVIPF